MRQSNVVQLDSSSFAFLSPEGERETEGKIQGEGRTCSERRTALCYSGGSKVSQLI